MCLFERHEGVLMEDYFLAVPSALGCVCLPTDIGNGKRLLTEQRSHRELGPPLLVQARFPLSSSGDLDSREGDPQGLSAPKSRDFAIAVADYQRRQEITAISRESLGLSKWGLEVLVHNCPRLPKIAVILRRKFPLERGGPQGPQKRTIVDDCVQIAQSGPKPPFESPQFDFAEVSGTLVSCKQRSTAILRCEFPSLATAISFCEFRAKIVLFLQDSADCKRGRRKGATSKNVKKRQKVSKNSGECLTPLVLTPW